MSVLLTRKAVLQGAMETSYNSPASVGNGDGFLVSNPAFTIKPNVLERNFVRQDLSPMPFIIGRKLASMEFETELRGNGLQNSGNASDAALITRLFRASGYRLSSQLTQTVKGPFGQGQPSVEVSWAAPSATSASDVFTVTGQPNDGDKLAFGGQTYTWKTALTPAVGEVLLGSSAANALANMKNAVNGGPGAGTAYANGTTANKFFTASNTASALTIAHKSAGTVGNGRAVSYTPSGSSMGSWATPATTGGRDIASNSDVIAYYLTVDTAGASGAAKITVTSDTAGEGNASAVVTSGSPITVGGKGLTLTPTWSGNLAPGQSWTVWLMPVGLSLDPISDNFESITLVLHKDGVLHEMPGSYGTFEITAQAGDFATVKWTFTGTYVEPTDDPNPSPIFERTLPSQVELARLRVGGFAAVVEKFTFNQMNDIQIRPDVSSSDGYVGTRIVSRKPEGGINPEADLVENNDFWGQLAAAQEMPLQLRIGHAPGNTVWMLFPTVQYSGLTYTDRNGILAYDAGIRFARSFGNDEACFYFC
jgi:hypothetical protein